MPVTSLAMANAIRALSMDAVHRARSGHQGMPLGMADVASVLWTKFLKFDADAPYWPDRDRFVLSAGHGSILLYALLHLSGFKAVTMRELENFRQWASLTPGHPEFGHTPGVETTTGPLGQGLATAVGMAMAERALAARYGAELVDHRTWVVAGDGCLMEGVSHEAISLAGRLNLHKLTVLFDDNDTTIDGRATLAERGDQLARFKAAGWAVKAVDGHDHGRINSALRWARKQLKPTMIACKTVINRGAGRMEGSDIGHGYSLMDEEIAEARVAMNWASPPFVVPKDIAAAWSGRVGAGDASSAPGTVAWPTRTRRQTSHARSKAIFRREPSTRLMSTSARWPRNGRPRHPRAFRRRFGRPGSLHSRSDQRSADLTGSNNTFVKGMTAFDAPDYAGRFVHYGVREFAMAAAMNGMAAHGGLIPVSGTFLVFSDYSRPAIRLGALMGVRVVHVMTHDSVGVGEDGPTHQPVEHLASLRAMPGLLVFRPADAVETAECWKLALTESRAPSIMALSRQKTAAVRDSGGDLSARGAYELRGSDGEAQVTIFASGAEVAVAVASWERLRARGISARVVSTPCWELFDRQSGAYRAFVIGSSPVRIAVEAGVRQGWDRFIGEQGLFVECPPLAPPLLRSGCSRRSELRPTPS